ncbi:MAG TPA: hypothetical protein VLD62_00510 [Acidimicrobiia bacterium]|nr:hypothetical protein [Acidimicrobiia bacterium]
MTAVDATTLERIRQLLEAARDRPVDRASIGQEAAVLWWELDEAGACNTEPPEPWEEALLGLAAWHTGDDRLRLQRADDAAIERYLRSV